MGIPEQDIVSPLRQALHRKQTLGPVAEAHLSCPELRKGESSPTLPGAHDGSLKWTPILGPRTRFYCPYRRFPGFRTELDLGLGRSSQVVTSGSFSGLLCGVSLWTLWHSSCQLSAKIRPKILAKYRCSSLRPWPEAVGAAVGFRLRMVPIPTSFKNKRFKKTKTNPSRNHFRLGLVEKLRDFLTADPRGSSVGRLNVPHLS